MAMTHPIFYFMAEARGVGTGLGVDLHCYLHALGFSFHSQMYVNILSVLSSGTFRRMRLIN